MVVDSYAVDKEALLGRVNRLAVRETAARNPDTVRAALKMYSGHPERAVNCDSLIDGQDDVGGSP
jgi:hypothetical protein